MNNGTDITCEELPAWGVPVGIVMGVIGSIGINVGQNIQATGLAKLPEEERTKPHRSKTWRLGMALFVAFSLVNFAALALAPASILTPLESLQFVTNIVYNRFINKKQVTLLMAVGVACALVGTVLTVVFGPPGGGCHSLDDLASFWTAPLWIGWFVVTLFIAAVAFAVNIYCTRRRKAGHDRPAFAVLLPITFTLSSALGGGSQMIVHSKAISVLLSQLFQGNVGTLASYLFYVELTLVSVCGIIWIVRLTECLALYDPLLILPLMIGSYVLFGGVAGGIFFQEFANMAAGPAGLAGGWALFLSGMMFVLVGLAMIAAASMRLDQHGESSTAAADDEAGRAAIPGRAEPPSLDKQQSHSLREAYSEASEQSRRLRQTLRPHSSAAEPASPLARLLIQMRLDRVHARMHHIAKELSTVVEVGVGSGVNGVAVLAEQVQGGLRRVMEPNAANPTANISQTI